MGKTLDDPDTDDEENETSDDDDFDAKVQAELDKRAKGIKRAAAKSGRDQLLKDLGFDGDPDALKTALAKLAEKPAAPKTDQKEDGASAAELAELRDKLATAESRAAKAEAASLGTRVVTALMGEGLDFKKAQRAARMVGLDKPSASDDEIAEAIDDLKDDMPDLFKKGDDKSEDDSSEGQGQSRELKKSNPGSTPPSRKRPADPQATARARLASRHPNLNKS